MQKRIAIHRSNLDGLIITKMQALLSRPQPGKRTLFFSFKGSDPLPDFEDEFYLVVSDYMHGWSEEVYMKVKHEGVRFSHGYDIPDEMCYNSTKQADGLDSGVVPFDSGVFNGKGMCISFV